MIKLEKQMTYGWEEAIRGMRNPMNSWEKSDSDYVEYDPNDPVDYIDSYEVELVDDTSLTMVKVIGPNDLDLMTRLRNAGTDHRKFMRMITVYVDITAPLYWWKEFDTYKVGTVANSCSTMHKIHAKEFELDDFSHEHLSKGALSMLNDIIEHLNFCRKWYVFEKDKGWWWQMIQLLPSSYNQKRTVMLNYEVLTNMYHARKNHKLDEWHTFCEWVETLPYSEFITGGALCSQD
jgi:hypothetical protein